MKKYTKPSLEVITFDNSESIMQLSAANFNSSKMKKDSSYTTLDF